MFSLFSLRFGTTNWLQLLRDGHTSAFGTTKATLVEVKQSPMVIHNYFFKKMRKIFCKCDRIGHCWFLGRLSTGQNLFKGGASSSKTWTPDWPSIMNLWFQEYNFITGTYFHEGYILELIVISGWMKILFL